jgi:cytochrome c oxidase assembly protein subunit 15
MPQSVTGWTRALAWANLVVNILIVGTGGLVRLTGSGLGCPTWPLCTTESLVPTKEMGIHGLIEFGNRTLTGVLVVVALLTFLAVFNAPKEYGLRRPAFLVGILIIVQAAVGGVTVLFHLDPRIVGVHFLISVALVGVATMLLQRVRLAEPLPIDSTPKAPRAVWVALMIVAVLTWITEIVGVLTTGAGPHAGDSIAARNGLNAEVMQHVHSWPAYALAAALVVLLVIVGRSGPTHTRRGVIALTVIVVVQIAFGVYQSRTGLPVWSVATHMILAVVAVAQLTLVIVNARRGR